MRIALSGWLRRATRLCGAKAPARTYHPVYDTGDHFRRRPHRFALAAARPVDGAAALEPQGARAAHRGGGERSNLVLRRPRLGPWGTYKSQGDGTKWAIEAFGELKEGELRPTTPDLRLKDMDQDGVDATVMYGHTNDFPVEDPQLREAVYAAYNDWVWAFCSYAPNRLLSVAQLPAEDPNVALRELERAARTGFKHVNVMAAIADPPIYCEEWEPFWIFAEETGIPVGFHLAVRISPPPARVPQAWRALRGHAGAAAAQCADSGADPYGCAGSLPEAQAGDGGIRHRLGAVHDPAAGRQLSQNARRSTGRRAGGRLRLEPSEYFTRQIWMTFQDESDRREDARPAATGQSHSGAFRLSAPGQHLAAFPANYPGADAGAVARPEAEDSARQCSRAVRLGLNVFQSE